MSDVRPMTISIKDIQEKTSAKGKTFWSIQDNGGDYYSVWDKDVFDRLPRSGEASVSVDHKESGGKTYRNIVGIAPPSSGYTPAPDPFFDDMLPSPPPKSPAVPLSAPVTPSMREIKLAAIVAATQLAIAKVIPATELAAAADRIVEYTLAEYKNGSNDE